MLGFEEGGYGVCVLDAASSSVGVSSLGALAKGRARSIVEKLAVIRAEGIDGRGSSKFKTVNRESR